MLRCTECKAQIITSTAYTSWISLYDYLHFQRLNEEISEDLFQHLVDCLMTFKRFTDDCEKEM